MKTGYIILIIALLILVSGVAGYFIHQPKTIYEPYILEKPVLEKDPRVDSLQHVATGLLIENDSLKKRLSKYSRINQPIPISPISLPCDTFNILGDLQGDISIYNEMMCNYDTALTQKDTIIKQGDRFNYYLKNELYKTTDKLAALQTRYNTDTQIPKKEKKKFFLYGTGSGAIIVLVFALLL